MRPASEAIATIVLPSPASTNASPAARAVDLASEVHVENPVPVNGILFEEPLAAVPACVVHEDVEAGALDHDFDHPLDDLKVGHVSDRGEGVAVIPLDGLDRRLGALCIDVIDRHGRTFPSESSRVLAADAAAGANHQRRLRFEPVHATGNGPRVYIPVAWKSSMEYEALAVDRHLEDDRIARVRLNRPEQQTLSTRAS